MVIFSFSRINAYTIATTGTVLSHSAAGFRTVEGSAQLRYEYEYPGVQGARTEQHRERVVASVVASGPLLAGKNLGKMSLYFWQVCTARRDCINVQLFSIVESILR
eukprot:scaffold648959_cov36-Prasinocladus_malaysianus.AAC.1